MNKEELVEFLKNNLRIEIEKETSCYSDETLIEVYLLLEQETISKSYILL